MVTALDVGLSIDLARCKQLLSDLTEAASIKHKGHAPTVLPVRSASARMTRAIEPLEIAAGARPRASISSSTTSAASRVTHTLPFAGSFEQLIELSCALAGTELFVRDARTHAGELLS